MNICSFGHEEVVYEAWRCPACAEKEEKEANEKIIEELEQKIEEYEAFLEDVRKLYPECCI